MSTVRATSEKHGQTNGMPHSYRVPDPGCYVPAVTFFDPQTDKLDLDSQARYYAYLATTGLKGIVVLGTNAETFLLTREERKALVRTARKAVPPGYPIIAGVGAHSTAQALEYISDAHDAGADFLLLLPCAYFAKQTTSVVVLDFFAQVCAESPLPIIVYNFPGVCNGLDMDSDLITAIARQSEKVVGVKLTCGSVGKISRLAATFSATRFAIFGGQSDFLIGGLAVGSAGCIAAFANIFPSAVARLYTMWTEGNHLQALKMQHALSLAEAPTKAGIASTKYAAAIYTAPLAGIEEAEAILRPRRPYLEPSMDSKEKIRQIMDPARWLEEDAASRLK